jgi:hypothetical protein
MTYCRTSRPRSMRSKRRTTRCAASQRRAGTSCESEPLASTALQVVPRVGQEHARHGDPAARPAIQRSL